MAPTLSDPEQQDEEIDAFKQELDSLPTAEPDRAVPSSFRREPVYKVPGDQPSAPPGRNKNQETPAGQDLDKAERLAGEGETPSSKKPKSAKDLNDLEQNAGSKHKPESFYKNTADSGSRFSRLRAAFVRRRKRVIIGGSLIGATLSTVLVMTFLAGPLQFIHLSHILSRGFSGDEHTSHLRLTRLYRYAKTGQVGETRVGALGSRVFGKSIDQLRDAGIEFQNDSRGYMKSATFDTAKLEEKFPEMKGMSLQDQKNFLGEKFGLDPASFNRVNGRLAINTRDFGVGATRALLGNSLDVLDNGKIISSVKLRVLSDYFDVPSLWHPLERIKANQYKKLSVKVQRAAAKKAEEDRLKALETTADKPEAVAAKTKIKNALRDNQGKITSLLLVQGTLCIVRSIADDAVTYNRAAIVLPATIQAADKTALGNQVESGQDFDNSQLSATADSFKDSNGQTIWQGAAMQAAAGTLISLDASGKPIGAQDLPTQFSQAFSGKTTADNIRKSTVIRDPIFGVDITSAACSTAGQLLGAAVGLVAIFGTPFTGGGSAAAFAAIKAGEIAATAGILYMLQHELTPLVEDKVIVPDVLSGPLGGNLLAYGGREMANIAARSDGGTAMPGTETSVVSAADQAAENKQFASKSWFAKLFDAKDYRSATGKLIDSTSTSFVKNLAKMGSAFLHIGRIYSSVNTLLFHHAAAASQPYNWGFPRYGIPDSVAADPQFDDPYANADTVAAILDGQDCNLDSSCYINRAKNCFGVDISKVDNLWQVKPRGDVNPGSGSYTDAHCDENSDNWHRLQLFVFDSRTMDATACYEGDSDSCANTGVGAGATATSSASAGGVYVNPLRDVQQNSSLTAKRVDQGVDYGGSGPIYALGNGVVKTISTTAGWPNGNFINYQLSDGPAAGKYVFVAENCTPNPALKVGQNVTSSTVLCTMQDAYPFIETGWAADPSSGTIALAHDAWTGDVDNEAHYTALGRNFSDLLQSLGAPAGTVAQGAQQLGTLPAGWPTW